MVNWRQWDLMDLFKEKDPENLLAMSLPETTLEERLHLYELLSPVRLLDLLVVIPTRVNRLCQLLSGRCLTGSKHRCICYLS